MTKHFHKALESLKKRLLTLGAMVEERVHLSAKAVLDKDIDLAQKIYSTDFEVDELEVELEEECLKVMALHQPVAVDLRFLVAVIKINNELERIGDQAVNVAQRAERIASDSWHEFTFDYAIMAEKAQNMLKLSLDALVNYDIEVAYNVLHLDDEVDAIKNRAYDVIKQAMGDYPDRIGYLYNLLLISRHLERVADHATNIAEEVIYMIEGEIVRHGNRY